VPKGPLHTRLSALSSEGARTFNSTAEGILWSLVTKVAPQLGRCLAYCDLGSLNPQCPSLVTLSKLAHIFLLALLPFYPPLYFPLLLPAGFYLLLFLSCFFLTCSPVILESHPQFLFFSLEYKLHEIRDHLIHLSFLHLFVTIF
jgi:hypothetical protein